MSTTLKIFFSCTGVGTINRGIESFFREAFDGLRNTPGLAITLYKGAGSELDGERVLWNLDRAGWAATTLGKLAHRNGYVVEQLSSLLPMALQIRRHRPDIIYYSDANLGFQLHRWRRLIGIPYALLFSNGGPCSAPFHRTDYIHQVAPYYFDLAATAGVSPAVQSMVPYGITVPAGAPEYCVDQRQQLRRSLGLPEDRQIVLSVGWISAAHKRMDYIVREIARLPEPRPHLMMLGQMDRESANIISLATRALGPGGFTARSVPYAEVGTYYRAADLFTLGSLREGFGRVYLEALIHGLPCIVHDHPVMRYVLGSEGEFADLAIPGALADALVRNCAVPLNALSMERRRESVRRQFSWQVLAPAYRQMFEACRARPGSSGTD